MKPFKGEVVDGKVVNVNKVGQLHGPGFTCLGQVHRSELMGR